MLSRSIIASFLHFVLLTTTKTTTQRNDLYISAFVVQNPTSIFCTTRSFARDIIIYNRYDKPPGKSIPFENKYSKRQRRTSLFGIRGFRAWFESQFPDAMIAFEHPPQNMNINSNSIRVPTRRKRNNRILNAKTPKQKSQANVSSSSSSSPYSETFDHVLIDVNQLLHITLRRSKTDDHALILLLKELDKCLSIAKPTKSITLAFDGPPSAAKLATQRRRRYGIIMRNVKKKERMEFLIQKGLILPLDEKVNKSGPKYKKALRKEEREELTLAITPGTEFMKRAEDAVLYWAWQRLSNPRGKMQIQDCRIYISPSSVPGEGEVKLLDWLFQAGQFSQHTSKVRHNIPIIKKGESVAIMGGDSDLVLEGLIIPPSITHNVFVILPSGNNYSYAVSLWETTRTLSRYLGERFNPDDTMRIRTDLVLLLIMNGNDYLPKLRGSSGFNKLIHTYLYILKKWLSKNHPSKEGQSQKPFFIDPNTLEWNLPFTIHFFETLSNTAPKSLSQPPEPISFQKSITPLSQLHSLVDSGLFPNPATFKVIKDDADPDKSVMRLTLGKKKNADNNSDDNFEGKTKVLKKYYEFELHHKDGQPLKRSKQLLAKIALESLLNDDLDINEFLEDEDDDYITFDNDDFGLLSSGIGYSWEMEIAAPCSVEEYIKGLVWNLATYQDGVCADYSYNYGRRMSPTADELLAYFKSAHENGASLGRKEILSTNFTEALSDGLSCLAALPTEVSHLIPEPYRRLSENGVVESIYATCMDKNTNVFDIELFQHMCEENLENQGSPQIKKETSRPRTDKGRKVRTGKTFWTVLRRVSKPLVHPYQPPPGFSDRLSPLRYDNKIKAFHMHSTDRPRWLRTSRQESKKHERSKFTSMQGILTSSDNLDHVKYIKVYEKKDDNKIQSKRARKPQKDTSKLLQLENINQSKDSKFNNDFELSIDNLSSMIAEYNISPPPDAIRKNIEDLYPVQCIQELHNVGAILSIEWHQTTPSISDYASLDPNSFELVALQIKSHSFEFSLSQDRNKTSCSRKIMKHHLASVALDRIFLELDWSIMTINDMKSYLGATRSNQLKKANVENRSALQCLNELEDSNIFDLHWKFHGESPTSEIVHLKLVSSSSSESLSWTEYRDIYTASKATTKQSLAESALQVLLGEENDWRKMTLQDMKDFIQYKSSLLQNQTNS